MNELHSEPCQRSTPRDRTFQGLTHSYAQGLALFGLLKKLWLFPVEWRMMENRGHVKKASAFPREE